jgi:phenylalanyl-tRNA synthetase alpha chain
MKEFYAKTGNHKLRFKPAYNPYTEVRRQISYPERILTSSPQPSMEIFSWHEGLQKWIEIANVRPSLNLLAEHH